MPKVLSDNTQFRLWLQLFCMGLSLCVGFAWALDDEECRQSRECAESGRCTAYRGECVVRSDKDCQRSSKCKDAGYCKYDKEAEGCIITNAGCAASKDCTENGNCGATWYGDGSDSGSIICAPLAAAHCSSSTTCKEDGVCTWDKEEQSCFVANDKDCKNSKGCKEAGRCAEDGGSCQVTNDTDCAKTTGCKQEGRCEFDASKRLCVATNEGCSSSTLCKKDGRCIPYEGAECITSQEEQTRIAQKKADAEKEALSDAKASGARFAIVNNGTVIDTKTGLMWASQDSYKSGKKDGLNMLPHRELNQIAARPRRRSSTSALATSTGTPSPAAATASGPSRSA